MKLDTLWMVLDPDVADERTTPARMVFKMQVQGGGFMNTSSLAAYIVGGGVKSWAGDHTALYTTRGEALRDAEGRLRRAGMRPARRTSRKSR
jgi:hypothetical protein